MGSLGWPKHVIVEKAFMLILVMLTFIYERLEL
jgi:hypothetical protein